MQLYFFGTLKVKKKGEKSSAVWSPQAGCAMFTDQGWATEPVLSLSLSPSSCLSLCLFFSFMWCCGSWLHSIQCNLSNPPCCDVVNKLQVNWFWFVTTFFFFFLSFALTCLKWEPSHWQKKKYFRLFKWTGFYFFYALLLTQCTKGLNETCSFALTLCVISSVVISLVFLCSLVSYVVVFFPKMLCRFKHNKCLALSVRGYFHITETMNNNQSIHHALLVA